MKSGVLVMVDLFSLLTMTMFSTFVISAVASRPNQENQLPFRIIEVAVESQSSIEQFFGTWVPTSELVLLGVTILDPNGKPVTRGAMNIEVVPTQLGFAVTIEGDVRNHKLVVDIRDVVSPAAYLVPFRISIMETMPDPTHQKIFPDARVGDWPDAALPL